MKRFVFRNATVEPFFPRGETEFSGYGDVSRAPADAEIFRWFYVLPPDAEPGVNVAAMRRALTGGGSTSLI